MEFGLMLEIRLHLSFVFAYEPKMCMQVFASLAQRIFRWMCVSCSTPQFECGNQISLHLHHNACLAVSPPPLSLPPFLSPPLPLPVSLALHFRLSLPRCLPYNSFFFPRNHHFLPALRLSPSAFERIYMAVVCIMATLLTIKLHCTLAQRLKFP